ncbi:MULTISPECIES: ABC transporter ATP-binding protein [unclassified Paenibacillus]|uniref:ABC transporter ATP-binding protein n=1 Tax=unclassified Paenibacillus TaxID=185978 RepID=UPI001AE4DF88|nr:MULTISPECIES: ABC transporter ATP-binding protein [unclassified Paenibacillus]MBP1154062.1 ABC-type Fe3+/spermidine/putrescine transport system ATPase subunit [Paenibacillus sp. PvP091]MBP1170553.1 ABC-type Fe3+/spermidine/putrescine transport system ATPase subunit [Paenibacillus sp. PvR098]MBP2441581.1 ABC-type Fe3+/spermidine/putrescine transport system ATPase subunit [Paenibacillus sp. PvP052]
MSELFLKTSSPNEEKVMKDGETNHILRLEKLIKHFGSNTAVNELSLNVRKGEIFTLLGPSGCGKTTTLRQIAGLEQPDSGKIYFRDKVLVSPLDNIYVPPHKRQMGMVFQSYAIWPHLTVFETVAYPLRARKVRSEEIRKRVMETLELVGLKGMENRPGPALSGGQQQRVAVARALVYEPEILLLDEPFSNLDVKLREQMRVELKLLQRRIGVTVILVTHDQLEALSFSDRIGIMNQGKIEQVGTPKELYEKPHTQFVRDFIGKNITLEAEIESVEQDKIQIMLEGGKGTVLTAKNNFITQPVKGQKVVVSIRPEDIVVNARNEESDHQVLEGEIDALLFGGDRFECHVKLGDEAILVYTPRVQNLEEGQKVRLYFPPEVLSVWPKS